MSALQILSGGAAQGLVAAIRAQFYGETGRSIEGSFGAVGAMREKLLAGEPCDVLILTQPLIAELEASGRVVPGSARPLGRVRTGIAVKTGAPRPDVGTANSLKEALRSASGIYFPDSLKATAGIHFMNVLRQLGLEHELAPRLHAFPNGAAAMQAMAQDQGSGLIGCTQATEILYTTGVELVAMLPAEFELATVYVAAVAAAAKQPQGAAMLIDMLTGPEAAGVRRSGGFE